MPLYNARGLYIKLLVSIKLFSTEKIRACMTEPEHFIWQDIQFICKLLKLLEKLSYS